MEAVRGRWSVMRGCGRLGRNLSRTRGYSLRSASRERVPTKKAPAPRPKAAQAVVSSCELGVRNSFGLERVYRR